MPGKTCFLIWLSACFLIPCLSWAHPGVGIVQDSKGNVFYTDLEQVWQITPEGKKRIAVKNVHTHELYLDAQDNLFGEDVRYEGEKTDKYHHRIWKRSPNGNVTELLGERPGFRDDMGFVRDKQGNQYWISYNQKPLAIRKRNAQGKITTIVTDKPLGHLSWLAVSADGNTLYATSSAGFSAIDPKGKVTSLLHESHAERQMLFGIWPAKNGEVYVADYGQNAIKKVAKSGEVSDVAKTAAPWAPSGITIAPDGSLWLLEYSVSNKARVRKIAPNGQEKLF